jgi:DNA-cytosine methyltransferase
MTAPLTVGSLFAGIGGIDLGLQRAGMEIRWQAENDDYSARVLAKHWPDVPNLGDVRDVDWHTVEPVDLIAGGYPCQPFSDAGNRDGEHDPRHLWPHMRNAVRVLRPRYALLENVTGHLVRGFGTVLADLAALRYRAEWDCIPAAAIGAPHLRDRVFVVAYAEDRTHVRTVARHDGITRLVADADIGPPGRNVARLSAGMGTSRSQPARSRAAGERRTMAHAEGDLQRARLRTGEPAWIRWRRPPHCSSAVRPWPAEPGVGRMADGIPHRVDRLRGLGNAVVPQVAEYVGRLIVEYDGGDGDQ